MSKRDQVHRISIRQVYPSLENPRKQLPRELVTALHAGMEHRAFLQEIRCLGTTHAGFAEFLKGLDDLATSIRQVGQLAPVRVLPQESERYVIELGERRWLAHLILFFEREDATFEHIDALLGSVAAPPKKTLQRRMAENVHRAEFSPLEMAKGLAARLDELQCELPALGLVELQARVGAENGIQARRVRQYLTLLTLDEAALELAEQGHLTERALRSILKYKTPAEQVAAVRRLVHPPDKKAPAKTPIAPKVWADAFVQNMLAVAQSGKQRAAYERALRVQLKRNPHAHALLARALPAGENRKGKHAVSQGPGVENGQAHKRQSSARQRGAAGIHPQSRARGESRRSARRRGRT